MNEAMWKWCHKVAADRTYSCPHLTEDAAQEGMIGWWEAWQHRPGNLAYAKAAARNRIVALVTGHGHPYGAPSRQGRRQVDEFYPPAETSLDDYDRRRIEIDAEMAYHRAEIAAVVRELTPRQRKIVAGVALDEVLTPSQRGEWSGRLRPRLAQRLAHLEPNGALARQS